jgi:hypothetical protein
MWGQLFDVLLGYVKLFTWQFEVIAIFQRRKDSNFLPELKIQERPPSTLRYVSSGPREMPELKVRQRPPSTLKNIDGGPPRGSGRTHHQC